MAYLRKQWTHRHIIVVQRGDVDEARKIAAEVAVETLGLEAGEADAEREAFEPVPGRPGLYWLATASFPAMRAALRSRLGRLEGDIYFAWLSKDGVLQADEAGAIDPKTGQIQKSKRAKEKKIKKLEIEDVKAEIGELLRLESNPGVVI